MGPGAAVLASLGSAPLNDPLDSWLDREDEPDKRDEDEGEPWPEEEHAEVWGEIDALAAKRAGITVALELRIEG